MKIPFYLLGLLIRYGPQHGYKLKQIIEERISDFAKIKLPTIYYHLDKLKDKGFISETQDKDGNRPEKMVYTITETGIKYFDELYRNQLEASLNLEFSLDGILYFKERIQEELLRSKLVHKKEEIEKKIEQLENKKITTLADIHPLGKKSSELIFDHHLIHLRAELEWLKNAIKGL